MQPGTKPLPTSLRLLNGNAAHRPLPKNEPQPAPAQIDDIDVPDHLTETARAHFRKTARILKGMRVLTEADMDAVAVYAESWGRYIQATLQIQKDGLITAGSKGQARRNPMLDVQSEALTKCMKLMAEFGLTPSSRTRVRTEP